MQDQLNFGTLTNLEVEEFLLLGEEKSLPLVFRVPIDSRTPNPFNFINQQISNLIASTLKNDNDLNIVMIVTG